MLAKFKARRESQQIQKDAKLKQIYEKRKALAKQRNELLAKADTLHSQILLLNNQAHQLESQKASNIDFYCSVEKLLRKDASKDLV